MRNHRTFIAINLPENVKKDLLEYQEKWPEIPARWSRKDNLHITLAFLGNISDEDLPDVCGISEDTAAKFSPFFITLKNIRYGPPKKPPRMIWAEGEESEELGKLQKYLENALSETPSNNFKSESRPFAPHITLARIRQWEFNKINPEERIRIDEEINFTFEVNSIEVMESVLKRGGPEYTILQSSALKENE